MTGSCPVMVDAVVRLEKQEKAGYFMGDTLIFYTKRAL